MSDFTNLKWNRPCIYVISSETESFNMLPGVNAVPSSLWNSIKDRDTIKRRFESGLLENVGEGSLEKLGSEKAAKLIEQTVSKTTLETWLKNSTDKIIIACINRQLKKLEDEGIKKDPNEKKEKKEVKKMNFDKTDSKIDKIIDPNEKK